MSGALKLTLAQINPVVGDLEYNREKILSVWREARGDLVVFPEMALCAYPLEDLVRKPEFLNRAEEQIKVLCEASKDFPSAAIIPCPLTENGKVYNALHVIEGGRIIHTQSKHHLPNYGVFDERRVFASGPMPSPFDFRGTRLGLMICEDMWFADVSARLKAEGARILIAPHGSPFDIRKAQARLETARARVAETGLPLILLNQIGGQDDLVFDGGSFALDGSGRVVARLPEFEEAVCDLSPFGEQSENAPDAPQNELERIYKALCLGLKDYITKNGFPGVILGLSGGIDSAISAVIAADALGAKNVHCVMIPSRFTSQESLEDAAQMAKNLGCSYEILSLEGPFAALEDLMDLSGLAHENTQSRLRGLMLMALSNASGAMVLSTGNKSEMAVGYATLYGDMNGGYNVLKDLYKTQVYALSRWRNARSPLIPERIITKIPTAELRENQTDQDSLPPYDILDDILECLIEREMGLAETAARGHNPATVLRVWKMLDRAEYKRRQSCPGVKISPRAFGRDRRYPITNRFANLLEK